MASYPLEDIMREARVAMDENAPQSALLEAGDIDTLTLDQILRSAIPDAARRIILAAPVYMLEGGHIFGRQLYWGDNGEGWTPLPDDFLRLAVFRMSDWERPVYSVITPDDPEYNVQHSRHRGLRGCPQRPVVAVAMLPEVGRVLQWWSCRNSQARISTAMYTPQPVVDSDQCIEIPRELRRPSAIMAAALACQTLGHADLAQLLDAQATALIEI